jgi:ketosteroid isomerase-like protein
MKRTSLLTVLIAALALVLSACGNSGNSGNTSTSGGDPAAAAKAFFEALYGGSASDALFCKAGGAEVKAALDQSKQAITASGAKIDVSGLKYEAANQSGDSADVKVSGKLKMTVAGTTNEVDYTALTLKMKNEDGGWKVCGMTA